MLRNDNVAILSSTCAHTVINNEHTAVRVAAPSPNKNRLNVREFILVLFESLAHALPASRLANGISLLVAHDGRYSAARTG